MKYDISHLFACIQNPKLGCSVLEAESIQDIEYNMLASLETIAHILIDSLTDWLIV